MRINFCVELYTDDTEFSALVCLNNHADIAEFNGDFSVRLYNHRILTNICRTNPTCLQQEINERNTVFYHYRLCTIANPRKEISTQIHLPKNY